MSKIVKNNCKTWKFRMSENKRAWKLEGRYLKARKFKGIRYEIKMVNCLFLQWGTSTTFSPKKYYAYAFARLPGLSQLRHQTMGNRRNDKSMQGIVGCHKVLLCGGLLVNVNHAKYFICIVQVICNTVDSIITTSSMPKNLFSIFVFRSLLFRLFDWLIDWGLHILSLYIIIFTKQ